MKMNRYIVIGIGLVLIFVGAGYMWFQPISKAKADIATQQARLDAANATCAELPSAQKGLEEAKAELKTQEGKLALYMNTRMPEIALTDRIHGMISYWQECSDILGPTLESFILSRPGVTAVGGVSVGSPPTNPNDLKADLIVVPIGQSITVRVKTFRQALEFFRQMKKCPRLVAISSVKVDGPSPDLTMTMGMTTFIFPTGGPDAPAIAEAAAAGGTPGGGAMPMGGMMSGGGAPMASAGPRVAAPPGVAPAGM